MNRHFQFCRLVALITGFFIIASAHEWQVEAASAKPNFILIVTDDQRFDSLGCADNQIIQTQHLDRLAAKGIRFRNSFVTTAICCVSRASIFSGQYQRRHGIRDFSTPFKPAQWALTYPALLRTNGYQTGFIGKFGVGSPKDIEAMTNHFDYWRGLPGQAGEWFINPADPTRLHTTAKFGNQALEFLDMTTDSQPFCLSISFNAPHARDGKTREFEPDDRDETLYEDQIIPAPATANDKMLGRLPEFAQKSEGRRRWGKRFSTPQLFQQTTRDYYRLITGIDREIGRIAAKLKERGLGENTIILFTSDNGFFLGERGMADKWFMYEESIRVPLIIYDPRLTQSRQGQSVGSIALNIDLAPTMLELAGVSIPSTMQGLSLSGLMQGNIRGDWRKDFFYEHHFGPRIIPPSEGIRTEQWTYIRWLPPNAEIEELYDLRNDPFQENNLASMPEHAAILKTLRMQWAQTGRALE